MTEHSAKRPRTNTGTSTESGPMLAALRHLPIDTLRGMLLRATQQHADIAAAVTAEYDKVVAAEQARVVDFDSLSKAAWRALNVTYRRMSQSLQFEMVPEAVAEVRRCIETIARQTRAPASFGTRRNGLETLRKIGKSIALAGSAGETLGREAVKVFQFEPCLERTMRRIARSFSAEEREQVMSDGEMEAKLKELEELADEEFIFEHLERVRHALLGLDSGPLDSEAEADFGNDNKQVVVYSESSESSESEDTESDETDDDDDSDDS